MAQKIDTTNAPNFFPSAWDATFQLVVPRLNAVVDELEALQAEVAALKAAAAKKPSAKKTTTKKTTAKATTPKK